MQEPSACSWRSIATSACSLLAGEVLHLCSLGWAEGARNLKAGRPNVLHGGFKQRVDEETLQTKKAS